jgi:hypothetical protein
MNFGMTVFDAIGVQTLGVEDFTIQKLAQMVLPANRAGGAGVKSDYILMDVPGYDPSTCFVTITPKAYAGYNQPGYPDLWGYVPTYKDLGGTRIGIYTYVNRRRPTGYHDNYVDEWVSHTVECVVEVMRVL